MNTTTQIILEDVIELIIEENNPEIGDDALVEAYEDVNEREKAITEIKEYLDQ